MATIQCTRCNTPNRSNAKFCARCGAPLAAGAPPTPPSAVGAAGLRMGSILQKRYRIESELGRGGFGAVYQAWDNNLSRRCAVKENLSTSPEAQRQFAREATLLANLSHSNLPRVTDHFTIPGQGQYLVMDYVDGQDLMGLQQQQGVIPVDQALEWISQVAEALAYLHKRQPPVVHRDIKPANIRITPGGRAMLVDFGLVKIFDPHMKTTVGARAVTPGFAPPEQYGQGITDARTDIYALGATLYNILTGQTPKESIQRFSGARMPLAHELNPRIPVHVGKAIDRAMALEPGDRFQDADAFRQALLGGQVAAPVVSPAASGDAWGMRGSTVVVKAPPEPQAPAAIGYPSVSIPDSPPSVTLPRTMNRGLLLGGGALALLALCIIVLAAGVWGYNEFQHQVEVARQQTETAMWRKTATVQGQRTATAQVPLTRTAQAQATRNAAAWATSTAQAQRTAAVWQAATATIQAWEAFVAPLGISSSRTLRFGPESGSLAHEADDGMVEDMDADVDLSDFVIQARFFNPYSTSVGNWDYGFMFRHSAVNDQFRLIVRSNETWALRNKVGSEDSTIIQSGDLSNLNTDDGGDNFLLLICQGDVGYLFVNGDMVSSLDLSVRMASGDISVVTGFISGDEIDGYDTDYEDFIIWSIP